MKRRLITIAAICFVIAIATLLWLLHLNGAIW